MTVDESDKNLFQVIVALLIGLQQSLGEVKAQLAGATKDFFTIAEVASRTGRAPYTVRSWVKNGRIRAERVVGTGPKGRLLIPRSELDKLVTTGRGENIAITFGQEPDRRTDGSGDHEC